MVRELNFYYASSYTNETLKVIVPIENGMAITNAFCPQSLEVGNSSIFLKPTRGEQEVEFNSDCLAILGHASNSNQKLFNDALKSGLDKVVFAHISRCGRLIYNDLLIYVDCWAYLLYAHNNNKSVVEKLYPHVVKDMVDKYLPYMKEQFHLLPFSSTSIYRDIIVKR